MSIRLFRDVVGERCLKWSLEATGKSISTRILRSSIIPWKRVRPTGCRPLTKNVHTDGGNWVRVRGDPILSSEEQRLLDEFEKLTVECYSNGNRYNTLARCIEIWKSQDKHSKAFQAKISPLRVDLVELVVSLRKFELFEQIFGRPSLEEIDQTNVSELLMYGVVHPEDMDEIITILEANFRQNHEQIVNFGFKYCLYDMKRGNFERVLANYLTLFKKCFGELSFVPGYDGNFSGIQRDLMALLDLITKRFDEDAMNRFISDLPVEDQNLLRSLLMCCYLHHGGKHGYSNNPAVIQLWFDKPEQARTAQDLSVVLQACVGQKHPELAVRLYMENPRLHIDELFDSVLAAYAQLKDWEFLQVQFEDLFGRGELPHIGHYSIVMHALADLGDLRPLQRLWGQIFVRKMVPDANIFSAMIRCHYSNKDYEKVLESYKLMENFKLKPNASVLHYMILTLIRTDRYEILIPLLKAVISKDGALTYDSFMSSMKYLRDLNENEMVTDLWNHAVVSFPHLSVISYKKMAEWYFKQPKMHKRGVTTCIQGLEKYPGSSALYSCLIDHYIAVSNLADAMRCFNLAAEKSIFLGNSMVRTLFNALLEKDNLEGCLEIMENVKIQKEMSRIHHYYAQLIETLCQRKQHYDAKNVYVKMLQAGIEPIDEINDKLLVGTLNSLGFRLNNDSFKEAYKLVWDFFVHSQKDVKFKISQKTATVIIESFTASGRFQEAGYFFRRYTAKYGFEGIEMVKTGVILASLTRTHSRVHIYFSKLIEFAKTQTQLEINTNKNVRDMFKTVWVHKLWHLADRENYTRISDYLKEFISKGYELDNSEWNDSVTVLLSQDVSFQNGLGIVEQMLIDGYIKKREMEQARESGGVEPTWPRLFLVDIDSLADKFLSYLNSRSEQTTEELDQIVEMLSNTAPRTLSILWDYTRQRRLNGVDVMAKREGVISEEGHFTRTLRDSEVYTIEDIRRINYPVKNGRRVFPANFKLNSRSHAHSDTIKALEKEIDSLRDERDAQIEAEFAESFSVTTKRYIIDLNELDEEIAEENYEFERLAFASDRYDV